MTAEVRYLMGLLMSGVDVRRSTAFSAAPALSISGGIRYHALSAGSRRNMIPSSISGAQLPNAARSCHQGQPLNTDAANMLQLKPSMRRTAPVCQAGTLRRALRNHLGPGTRRTQMVYTPMPDNAAAASANSKALIIYASPSRAMFRATPAS